MPMIAFERIELSAETGADTIKIALYPAEGEALQAELPAGQLGALHQQIHAVFMANRPPQAPGAAPAAAGQAAPVKAPEAA